MSRQASFIIAIPYAVALATGAQEAPVAEWNRAYLAATEKQRSGDYTKANAILEPVVKAALQLARDDKVAAALFAGYASIQQDLGQCVRAEEFYRRAVAMWTRLRPDGPERIIALHGLALLYIQRGQYSKAEQVLKDLEPPPPSKTSWPPSLQPRILNSLGFLRSPAGTCSGPRAYISDPSRSVRA
jgi:tetratricopeptide (TPR) repeat protein